MTSSFEILAEQGWEFSEESRGAVHGSVRKLEKDGLILSHDGHWSVQQYFVSSADGRWGDLQAIMSRIGLSTRGDESDLIEAAANANAIKGYLDSKRFSDDERAIRFDGMEKLRAFERSIGAKESWLVGVEDHLRQRSEWKNGLSGFSGIKYWGAAVLALIYLCYQFATAQDQLRFLLIVGAAFGIMFVGLFAMRFQNKI